MVQPEGGKATFKFDVGMAAAVARFGARSAPNAEEGASPVLGEGSELPAKGRYAISFAETVGKKSNAP